MCVHHVTASLSPGFIVTRWVFETDISRRSLGHCNCIIVYGETFRSQRRYIAGWTCEGDRVEMGCVSRL